MGKVKVKNVSRGLFDINLGFIKEGKVVAMKPDSSYILNEEEYEYLAEQCKEVFEQGFLEVVDIEDVTFGKVESENVMSNEDIDKILSKTIGKFRTEIKTITSDKLLSDIYKEAIAQSKDVKYLDAIGKQIKDCGNTSLVL